MPEPLEPTLTAYDLPVLRALPRRHTPGGSARRPRRWQRTAKGDGALL